MIVVPRCCRAVSVYGKDQPAAGATACAADISGAAARSLNGHVDRARAGDHARGQGDAKLLIAGDRGAQGLAVDEHDRGRDELTAIDRESHTFFDVRKADGTG